MENICVQFDRERVLSRLEGLKNYYTYTFNLTVNFKKEMLRNLYLELYKFAFLNNACRGRTTKLSRTEEDDNHVRIETKIIYLFIYFLFWFLMVQLMALEVKPLDATWEQKFIRGKENLEGEKVKTKESYFNFTSWCLPP